ncbi:MAG: LLM class flavin-dependent oxidoreductase [Candidatus Limnocylindrales bacterium]
MRSIQLGLVLSMVEAPQTGVAQRWTEIRDSAIAAEKLGFDTVWLADELLWSDPDWPGPRGWWECVAMASALAASTSRIGIGTWVLSALHRNPALSAKIVETIDEISNGRFILGYGSGHAGKQGRMFGYSEDKTIGRYEDALQVLVPLLREGRVEHDGPYHRASVEMRPRGPRPGGIPIMLGGHGPRTIGLAARHADIWSCYATESSQPEAFADYLRILDEACASIGRDPSSIGRSVGVFVDTLGDGIAEADGLGIPLSGTAEQIADTVRELGSMGFTRVEMMPWPASEAAFEPLGEVLRLLDA